MKGRYVGARPLRRLAWAWIEFIEEEEQDLDPVWAALQEVIGPLWPDERDRSRMRVLRADARREREEASA